MYAAKQRSTVALTAGLLTLMLAVGACDDGSTSPDGDASLSILLTDAPGDIQEAWVQITGIYLQGTLAGNGERVWLLEEDDTRPMTDLLTLSDDVEALVEDAVVPAGTYAQLRFIVGDAVIVVGEDGDEKTFATMGAEHPDGRLSDGTLQCPSCSETGFKVNLPDGAVTLEADAKILVVDFDVSQSFGREAGFSGMWVMHPVMSASDFEASGAIAGTVGLAEGLELPECPSTRAVTLEDFVPLAISGDITKSAAVQEDGSYEISFVEPDGYDLDYESTIELDGESITFSASHPASVDVNSGGVASADFTIDEASCE